MLQKEIHFHIFFNTVKALLLNLCSWVFNRSNAFWVSHLLSSKCIKMCCLHQQLLFFFFLTWNIFFGFVEGLFFPNQTFLYILLRYKSPGKKGGNLFLYRRAMLVHKNIKVSQLEKKKIELLLPFQDDWKTVYFNRETTCLCIASKFIEYFTW